MSEKTSIEWTAGGSTWNPVTGCTKVSPGCDHCYAELMSHRIGGNPGSRYAWATGRDGKWSGDVRYWVEELVRPLHWKKPRHIFVCSMSDLFHSQVPFEFIERVFLTMLLTPQHTYQVLTKRPGRMAHFAQHILPQYTWLQSIDAWPANVWAGTSVESQKYAPRLGCLARVPAPVRFVSAEPLLGPLDLTRWLPDRHHNRCIDWDVAGHRDDAGILDWCIAGGESGPGARPMNPDWVRGLRDQCQDAGVPFFFKQAIVSGKKISTPILDGRQWKEMPDGFGQCLTS